MEGLKRIKQGNQQSHMKLSFNIRINHDTLVQYVSN
jgi:hypothetical protein